MDRCPPAEATLGSTLKVPHSVGPMALLPRASEDDADPGNGRKDQRMLMLETSEHTIDPGETAEAEPLAAGLEYRRTGEIRVFLLDSPEIIRQGYRAAIVAEADLHLVGEAETAGEALARIGVERPDVVILTFGLPDVDGLEICRRIRQLAPSASCIMLAGRGDERLQMDAIEAGASALVPLTARVDELVASIRAVAGGHILLNPGLVAELFGGYSDPALRCRGAQRGPSPGRVWAQLTDREGQILDLVAKGHTNREIGDRLVLPEKTVKEHVSQLFKKEGVGTRNQLVVRAARSLAGAQVAMRLQLQTVA